MSFQEEQMSNSNTIGNFVQENYTPRKEAVNRGRDFETYLTADLALKFLKDETIENFKLSSNNSSCGNADDLVIELQTTEGARNYAIQMKYTESKQKKLTENSLKHDKKFQIFKFLSDYEKFKKNFEKIDIILFTNWKKEIVLGQEIRIEEDVVLVMTECSADPFINLNDINSMCYKFKSVNCDSVHQEYLDHFFLYTDQMNVEKLKDDIFGRFSKEIFMCEGVTERYVMYIQNWRSEVEKNIKLDKPILTKVIAIYLVSPYVRAYNFKAIKVNKKRQLFRNAILKFQLTLLDKKHESLVKNIFADLRKELKNSNKMKEVTYQFRIVTRGLTSTNFSITFWLLNKCPLMVRDHKRTRVAIHLCQDMKFILLTDSMSSSFESVSSSFEEFEHFSKFQNLSDLKSDKEDFSNIMHNFKCKVHKREVSLKDVVEDDIDIEQMFTLDTLVQMLNNPLAIHEDVESLPTAYIPRKLSRFIIDPHFLQECHPGTLIIICNFTRSNVFDNIAIVGNLNLVNPFENRSIYGTIDVNSIAFNTLCQTYPRNKCHQLKLLDNGELEWVRSNGSIADIKRYIKEDYIIGEEDLLKYEADNNVNVVCAGPGMGKTTLMKYFKNQSMSPVWTIMMNIRHHSKHFQENGYSAEAFINYIKTKRKYFDPKLLEILLMKHSVRYIWDGLDEVTEEHLDIVLNTIENLAKMGSKHWITSRTILKDKLESGFKVISRKIVPIGQQEQEHYIKERLRNPESQIVENIQRKIRLPFRNDILGIPMQLYVLTELFTDHKAYETLPTGIMNLSDLYEHLIDEQFKMYFEKQGNDQNYLTERSNRTYKKGRIENYEKAAAEMLFRTRRLYVTDAIFLKDIKEVGDSVGIISRMLEGDNPEFLHTSFGDYFAASYFSKNSNELKQLRDVIFDEKYDNLRFFLDMILAKDCPAHIAVLGKDLHRLKDCSVEELLKKDKGGLSVLQLACSWGTRCPQLNILEKENKYVIANIPQTKYLNRWHKINKEIFILLQSRGDPFEKDSLYEIDYFSYCINSSSLLFLAMLICEGNLQSRQFDENLCKILYFCVIVDYVKIFDVKQIPFIVNERGECALTHAAQLSGSAQSLQRLLERTI